MSGSKTIFALCWLFGQGRYPTAPHIVRIIRTRSGDFVLVCNWHDRDAS